MPPTLGRVLNVIRRLIDYGKQFAATLQRRATTPDLALCARPFATADLAAILARITSGLRRAAALEAALCRRAASGRDLTPSPVRMPAAGSPRPPRQVAPPDPEPANHIEDPRLARLPTEEEIAARLATGLDPVVRRRPVGAVIADICRDLGVRPGHLDRAFWDELTHAIIAYGGSLTCFLPPLTPRLADRHASGRTDRPDPAWPVPPPRSPAPATGPP